jgi:putative copper resistance protein D
MADPLIFVRAAHFAATLAACGTVSFVAIVAPSVSKPPIGFLPLRDQLSVVIWLALAIAIMSGAAWLVLLAADITGATIAEACLHGGAWPVLFDTRFGLVFCARLALAVALALLIAWPALRMLQLMVAGALIALLAWVGHAGATPGIAGDVHLISDLAHLLAAGSWLGALPAFVLFLISARHDPDWDDFLLRTTQRFSAVGMISVATLLASGLINSWNLLGGPRDLITTDYGRLIALKVGLFIAMVSIAAVNRFYLTPRLPKPSALRSLRRNSLAEIALGLCVLFFVGALGTLAPTAHKHAVSEAIPPGAAFVHIHAPEAMADVMINPGRPGLSEVTIRVMGEDLSRFPAKDVRLALEPPLSRSPTLERGAVEEADGAWRVKDIALSEPGIWTVRVTVTSQPGEAILLDAPIVIEP